jgi:hypothetical protein
MAKCTQFLVTNKLIHDGGEPFFSATPCANAPLLITAWIMDGYVKQSPNLDICLLVNARGTQTRAGKCDGYGGVRIRIPISVPPPNPYPCEGVCGFLELK